MLMLTHENLRAILGTKLLDLQKGNVGGPPLEHNRKILVPSSLDDLSEVSLMGVGAYGKVSLVRYKREQYALKAIMKRALVKMQMVHNLDNERSAMIDCQNTFTVQLLATYQARSTVFLMTIGWASSGCLLTLSVLALCQVRASYKPHFLTSPLGSLVMMQDRDYVYMLMEPLMGGDLRQYTLRLPNARLPEEHARFYIACGVQVHVRLFTRPSVFATCVQRVTSRLGW